jgi:chorismate mutase
MAHRNSNHEGQPAADPLRQCRQDIDRIDRVLAALLGERARLALNAGRLKLAAGEPLTSPGRERAVLAHVSGLPAAPLEPDGLVRIFQAIIDETRGAEERWLSDGR